MVTYLQVGTTLICLQLFRLVYVCSMRQFPSGGPSMSAVANSSLSFRILKSPLRQTFMRRFVGSPFVSLALSFLPLSRRAHVVIFSLVGRLTERFIVDVLRCTLPVALPSRIVRLVDSRTVMKLFHDSLVKLTHVLLDFRNLQKVNWSEPSAVGWFPYLFDEGAAYELKNLRCSASTEELTETFYCRRPCRKLSLLHCQKMFMLSCR